MANRKLFKTVNFALALSLGLCANSSWTPASAHGLGSAEQARADQDNTDQGTDRSTGVAASATRNNGKVAVRSAGAVPSDARTNFRVSVPQKCRGQCQR